MALRSRFAERIRYGLVAVRDIACHTKGGPWPGASGRGPVAQQPGGHIPPTGGSIPLVLVPSCRYKYNSVRNRGCLTWCVARPRYLPLLFDGHQVFLAMSSCGVSREKSSFV